MEIRPLDVTDIERAFDIRTRSFGPLPESARPAWEASVREAIDADRILAAYDGGLLVGRAMAHDFRQSWGGRVLPMAGIAGVVVAPEYRARGVGSALMRGLIAHCRGLGFALSCLYPATIPVYRQQGWEMAGTQTRYTLRTRLLRDLRGGGVAIREAGLADAVRMESILRDAQAVGRDCGPRSYNESDLAEDLEDDGVFSYLAEDGYLMYGWQGQDVVVHQIVARSVETAKALWAIVGSTSSVAEQVHAYLAPDDALHQLLSEPVFQQVQQTRWMLRLLHVRDAIAGRGFGSGVEVDVPLLVDDAQDAANCVHGRLVVKGGEGQFVESDRSPPAEVVRLTANGVAALYAGTPTASLVAAGLLTGGSPAQRELLDSAFSGRPAYLLDYF